MKVDKWFNFDALSQSPPLTDNKPARTNYLTDGSEQMTVYGRNHKLDDDWRLDFAAKVSQYEASNSDAAQPMMAYPTYTSPDQQRMMSEKTDTLGLCGALGGYVQCPNLP